MEGSFNRLIVIDFIKLKEMLIISGSFDMIQTSVQIRPKTAKLLYQQRFKITLLDNSI